MKKAIFLLIMTALTIGSVSAQRFGTKPNEDNTGAALNYSYSNPAVPSTTDTIKVFPSTYFNYIQVQKLTKNVKIRAYTGNSKKCDMLQMFFVSDTASAGHTVTFINNFATSGTLTVDSIQKAAIIFVFDGTDWVATGREKQ